ncbi:DUF5937 family protein [Nonomuraea sp. NPDC002799]
MRIELSSEDLATSRFAVSPLFELMGVLRVLSGMSRGYPTRAWVRRLAPVYDEVRRDARFGVLLALQGGAYNAGFITPPPHSMAQTFADDLATVRATPLTLAREEIKRCSEARPVTDSGIRGMLGSVEIVDLIADALDLAWSRLLAPDWPRIRSAYERDVTAHGAMLGRVGWAKTLSELHPRIRWQAGGIELARCAPDQRLTPSRGLLLVPSAFVWPGFAIYADDPWPCTLVYPAGHRSAFDSAVDDRASALARLMGKTRARLLYELREPTTTSQLAAGLSLSVGAVGDHLAILYQAGLLDRSRAGYRVLYRRTPLGDSLVAEATDDAAMPSEPE